MSFLYKDNTKWSNKCPRCNSNIVWSMASGVPGTEAYARCSRSQLGSVAVRSLRDVSFCKWTGYAVRQGDGEVRIRELDGSWIMQR